MGSLFPDQRLVDVWNDTSSSNRCLDQAVQLLVPTDRQLQVPWGDPLHLQIFTGVTRQLQNLHAKLN